MAGFLLLVAGLASFASYERFHLTVSNVYSVNLGVSRLLAEHMHHALKSAEALHYLVAERVEAQGLEQFATPASMSFLRELVEIFPEISFVVLLDGQGRTVGHSHSRAAQGINNADRDYFRRHRQGERLVIGDPVRSRSTGEDVFTLSRALYDEAGGLRAVIVAALDRAYFERVFIRRAAGDTVAAVRDSGTILTRWPQVPLDTRLPPHTALLTRIQDTPEGSYEAVSPIDHEYRYYSYSKVLDYPVYLLVSSSRQDVLAGWRNQTAQLVGGLIVVATVVILMARLLFDASRREEEARRQLEDSQRFQSAILDSVSAHLAIVASDGRILATNRAWREFGRRNGLPAGEGLEGSNYFEACREADLDEARAALAGLSSVLTGATPEFQLDYACHSPDEQRWFTLKATPLLDGHGAVLVSHENVTRLMEAKQALRAQAETDALTGLANRRRFFEVAELHFELARQHKAALALLLLDCDHFKRVNDVHGHEVGDQVLVAVAKAISRAVRKKDLVARLGGEEFVVLLPETELEGAIRVAHHVRAAVAAHPGPVPVTISVGVAAFARGMNDVADLLRAADAALYTAKQRGRDRVEVASGMLDRRH